MNTFLLPVAQLPALIIGSVFATFFDHGDVVGEVGGFGSATDEWREERRNTRFGIGNIGGALHIAAQLAAAAQADTELADELFEFARRLAFNHCFAAHIHIAQQQLAFVGGAGLKQGQAVA